MTRWYAPSWSATTASTFWLSRNGHGAGFFDRGNQPVFARLQAAARVYSTEYVYRKRSQAVRDIPERDFPASSLRPNRSSPVMPQYDDELRGVLFKNDKKGNDKAPDYKGNVQVGGVKYELAAWLRTSQRSGQKFMSLKLDPPRDQSGAAPAPPAAAPTAEDFGMAPGTDPDDIPF